MLDASELFEEIGFNVEDSDLYDDILRAFLDQDYCKQDYFGPTASEFQKSAWGAGNDLLVVGNVLWLV